MKQKYIAECRGCKRRRIEGNEPMDYQQVYTCDACGKTWKPLGFVDGRVAIIWHEEAI